MNMKEVYLWYKFGYDQCRNSLPESDEQQFRKVVRYTHKKAKQKMMEKI